MDRISIIIPVYNVEHYLHRCVDSILSQTYANFTLLLIDDGSPDNCGTICDEYAKKDSRIVVIHQGNSGVSSARNFGIEWTLSHPEFQWLAFIDSDDWIHPMYLESLITAATRFSVKISQVNILETETTIDHPFYTQVSPVLLTAGQAYRNYGVCPWGKLFHTSLLKDIRFPVGIRHEDEFTTYRIIFSQSHIAHINERMYFYFIRSNSFMHSGWSKEHLACLDARDEQLAFFLEKGLPEEYSYIYRFYLSDLEADFHEIKKSSLPDRSRLLKQIRKRTRHVLRHHGPAPRPTVQSHPAVYNIAYPRYMNVYWTFHGICSKIKKTVK